MEGLKQRIETLEKEVAELKRQLEGQPKQLQLQVSSIHSDTELCNTLNSIIDSYNLISSYVNNIMVPVMDQLLRQASEKNQSCAAVFPVLTS